MDTDNSVVTAVGEGEQGGGNGRGYEEDKSDKQRLD